MDDMGQIVGEKIARITAAVDLESHDRVPLIGQADFWPVGYSSEYTMQDAFYDIDILAECYKDAFSEWKEWDAFDPIMYAFGPMLDATGSVRFNVPGREISPKAEFQHPDLSLMEAEEYPELIHDPVTFLLEKILPRLCNRIGPDDFSASMAAIAKATIFFRNWLEKVRYYGVLWSDSYGIPPMLKGSAIYMPMDFIADKLRGFYNSLIDIKERPEEVQAACEALVPFSLKVARPPGLPGAGYPLLFNPQHVSPFLSPKDYEKVYWPTFKKMIDHLRGGGQRIWVFFENNQVQHLERLQDLPKGMGVAHMENTDLAQAKKALGGKICIAGGMPPVLLTRGTPEDVKKHTKSVLEHFEDETGFIMTCSTPIPVNAKAENIHVWLNTVREYGHIGGAVQASKNGRGMNEIRKDNLTENKTEGIKKKDSDTCLYTDWRTAKKGFGEIKGDEGVIRDKWEELEMAIIPLLYWLIK
jgi:hypothetical protein